MSLKHPARTGLDFSRICTLLFVASGVLISTSGSALAVIDTACALEVRSCFDLCHRVLHGIRLGCYNACIEKFDKCKCNRSGKIYCSGDCVDTQTDSSNCGKCGNSCNSSYSCSGGVCGCSTGMYVCITGVGTSVCCAQGMCCGGSEGCVSCN